MKFLRNHVYESILCLSTVITLLYYSWDINSWRFAYVGDEWPFYLYARAIVIHYFLVNPFDFHGVFHQNSLLSSMYQALFLQLFGFSNFAWRLSNIVLIIPITVFCYWWIKKLFDRTIALFSVLFLQSSFYLANFLKIGKNMPQALALFLACCYFAQSCVNKPSPKRFFFLGVLLGISFYIYIGPLFPLLLWPIFLPLFTKKLHWKRMFRNGCALISGYVLLLLPLVSSLGMLSGPAEKTFFSKEYEGFGQLFLNIGYNLLLFYHNFDYLPNHFVTGPAFDIITQSFILLGTILAIRRYKQSPYRTLLLSYLSACLVIGITSPYAYAATTRSIFFLPFGAVFAGIALQWMLSLHEKQKNIPLQTVGIIILFLLIFLFNFYKSQVGVFKESGHTGTALFLKELQEAQKQKDTKPYILTSSDQRYVGYRAFPAFREAYALDTVRFSFIKAQQLDCTKIIGAQLFVFRQDKKAQKHYQKLRCPPDNHTVTILSPTMPF